MKPEYIFNQELYDQLPPFIHIEDVERIIGKSTTTVYRYIQQHGFPKKTLLGWSRDQVFQWVSQKVLGDVSVS